MLQKQKKKTKKKKTRKTWGFKKIMVYKIPPGGGWGKLYLATGLIIEGKFAKQ